jgi:arylsulfatase A-like enzyme
MNRRVFLSSLGGAVTAASARGQSAERPPNVLFLLFDKCRTDAIGAYGERDVHTPNIDKLAAGGVRFANCYTPQALCGPARASILTGCYPHQHGLRRNVYPHGSGRLNSNYQEPIADPFRDPRFELWYNFAYLLNAAGYETAQIGKWHLGPGNPGFFDYYKGFNSLLHHWIGEPHRSRYRPDVHTEQGIDFIDRNAGRPFFLYQSYYAPHAPDDPPKEYLERYAREEHAGYYGAVSNLDWNVGRLIEALRRHKLLDNTFIILSTEHGRSWDLRPGTTEGMCTAYEESSRIPLLMHCPKLLPSRLVWESGVSLVDLAPTIHEAAGIIPPSRAVVQGRSLISLVRDGQDRWDRPVVMQNVPQAAVDGSYYDERAIRDERYKLILRDFDARPELRPGELYDLRSDPKEKNNLYSTEPAIVKRLAGMLKTWGGENGDDRATRLGAWAAG